MIRESKCRPLLSSVDHDLYRWSWHLNRGGYAMRANYKESILLHRVILSRKIGRSLTSTDICDHANGDKLDCRRSNLRLTDYAGNAQSRNYPPTRGTTWHRSAGKWQATVKHKNKCIYIGLFNDRGAAIAAAQKKRRALGFLERTR